MGPMPQDAYYYFYSRHLALSYFDHPPMIAYVLKLFTLIFGDSVIAIKLANTFLTIFTSIAFYQLAIRLLPKCDAEKAIILFLSTLMVSILSLVSTPDTPLLFFWTLSLIALYEAIFKNKNEFWIIAGILMGLAFDSKYTAVFLPFGSFIFLIFAKSKRNLLTSFWPYLSYTLMLIVSSPVIIWNVVNHFASFAFQGAQRLSHASGLHFRPKFIAGLLGHQLVLLIPVLFVAILYAVVRLLMSVKKKLPLPANENLFLLCFFLPIFAIFLVLSPIYWIKINWMMPAYVSGIIIAAKLISKKWIKIQLYISCIIHLALLVQILFYLVPIQSDDTWFGWKELSVKTIDLKKRYDADFIFSADGYKTSSELNLYSNTFIYSENVIGKTALQYDFIGTDLNTLNGKTALYIDSDPQFTNNERKADKPIEVEAYFKSVTQLKPILIKNRGKAVRKFYVYLCKGYKFLEKR